MLFAELISNDHRHDARPIPGSSTLEIARARRFPVGLLGRLRNSSTSSRHNRRQYACTALPHDLLNSKPCSSRQDMCSIPPLRRGRFPSTPRLLSSSTILRSVSILFLLPFFASQTSQNRLAWRRSLWIEVGQIALGSASQIFCFVWCFIPRMQRFFRAASRLTVLQDVWSHLLSHRKPHRRALYTPAVTEHPV